MEQRNNIPKSPARIYWVVLSVLFVVLALVALQYSIFTVRSIREKMKSINEKEDVKLLGLDVETDTAYSRLYKEKSWLETRSQIAMTDSISLSVNLSDSTWQIELKGVVLDKAKIIDYKADRFFYQLGLGAYHHLLGKQAQADTVYSTIPKVPIVVKKAPKDTTEVDESIHIDTVDVEVVHWILKLDNSIVLKIEGVNPAASGGWWNGHKFWIQQLLTETKQNLARTLYFKSPEYLPEIRLEVSEADAKAFYRALPLNPLICIRL